MEFTNSQGSKFRAMGATAAEQETTPTKENEPNGTSGIGRSRGVLNASEMNEIAKNSKREVNSHNIGNNHTWTNSGIVSVATALSQDIQDGLPVSLEDINADWFKKSLDPQQIYSIAPNLFQSNSS
eukprot:11781677-Ditylum_brightwellii.AAC.1